MTDKITIEDFAALAGQSLGASAWLTIDQRRVSQFADVTEDHQFIHVDPEKAAALTPFGGTIAHGFLTLSLLSHLNSQVFPQIANRVMTYNYGADRIRFLHPVATGARIRSHVVLQSVVEKEAGRYLCKFESRIEIEHIDVPALIAEQLLMHVIAD